MERIPIPVLSQILTSVGPIYELIQIALVCKRWKKAIEATYLNISFQGTHIWKFQSSKINPEIILSIYNSKSISFKIQSLDLRNVNLVSTCDYLEIISQPGLLKLNLTNAFITLNELGQSILKYRKMRDEFEFGLEELRISNNWYYPIDFDSLIKIFPNLKILYAGNTRASREDFINIVKGFKKLELLDVTNCSNIGQMDENLNELKEALSGSRLRKLFITDLGPKTINYLEKCHIEVVNKWIGTILDELNDESDLQYLENWLNLGIDVDLGKNDNFSDKNNIFPYWELIRSNKSEFLITEAFKIMIRHGLNLCFYSNEYNISLLNTAISVGNYSLVDLFLKHKADIWPLSIFHIEEVPAVTYASFCGNIPIFQLFLKHNLYPKGFDYKTFCNPICAALRNSQKEMFQFFKQNNFSDFRCKHNEYWILMPAAIEIVIENWDYFPFSILHEAARHYITVRNEDLVLKIIDSLIKKAIAENQQETLRNLINIVEYPNPNKPIIVHAADYLCTKVVEKLVESGFDINAVDYNGWTPIIASSLFGNLDSVVYLLNHGAIIDKKDRVGQTALHYAAENGHVEIINELIRFGADLSPTCKKGYSPLDLAEKSHKTEAYNLLKSLGAKKGKNCRVF